MTLCDHCLSRALQNSSMMSSTMSLCIYMKQRQAIVCHGIVCHGRVFCSFESTLLSPLKFLSTVTGGYIGSAAKLGCYVLEWNWVRPETRCWYGEGEGCMVTSKPTRVHSQQDCGTFQSLWRGMSSWAFLSVVRTQLISAPTISLQRYLYKYDNREYGEQAGIHNYQSTVLPTSASSSPVVWSSDLFDPAISQYFLHHRKLTASRQHWL